MNRPIRWAAALVALGTAACSTAAADDEAATGGAARATTIAAGSIGEANGAGDEPSVTSGPGVSGPASAGPASTEPVSTLPPASAPALPPPADQGAGEGVDEGALDEPVFDAAPALSIDVGATVLEVDDAGIGGSVPSTGGTPSATLPPATGWGAFDAALEASLIRFGNTAASVAVSIGGDVVHTAAFGSRPLDGSEPAQPGDRFRIASISKTLTAITLLQLVEDGLVGLDDPVGGIVASSLGIANPPAGVASITLRQLLTHTSGFGKYDGVFFRGQSSDCRQAATIGLRAGAGGGGYLYSNMNYCVAGQLIEALTGRSYEAVVYERLLTPLGLSGLRLAPTFDPGPGEIQHPTTPGRNYMETLGASGGWLASPEDLVVVLDSLDLSTPGWKPLELSTLVAMQTPAGGGFGQRGYGMGLILYGPGRYGHTGTIENTHAMAVNDGDGVIWAITVSGPYPDSTPQLQSIINAAFAAGGFVAG